MRRISFLAILISTLMLHGCARAGQDRAELDDACAVAIAHAANFRRDEIRPVAVRTHAQFEGPTIEDVDATWRERPDSRKDADLLLLRKAAETRNTSVVDRCAALKIWLSKNAVIHSDPEIDGLVAQEPWPVAVLTMSLPAISDDGSSAMFYASEYWGGLGGSTDLIIYRKNKDGWAFARRIPLTIS